MIGFDHDAIEKEKAAFDSLSNSARAFSIIFSEFNKAARIQTCQSVCGMDKPCGNRFCSANPRYSPPIRKRTMSYVKSYIFPYVDRERKSVL